MEQNEKTEIHDLRHWISSICSRFILTNSHILFTSNLSLSSFWVFFWWLWACTTIPSCMFLSHWNTNSRRVYQWARPSLDWFLWICEVGRAKRDVRRIKSRIKVMKRTQRIAKCSILVWRRKLLAFTLRICMCYQTPPL